MRSGFGVASMLMMACSWDISRLDPNQPPKYPCRANPPVYTAAIIVNLKSIALNRLHKVKVFSPAHLAKHDIARLN
jgi:hypothetical protein